MILRLTNANGESEHNMIRGPLWDKLRSTGIGGSEAAAACGVSRWKTPLRLYLEKRGEKEQDDISDQENVYWGLKLEPLIGREYAMRTGVKLVTKHMKRSTRRPWMVANVDKHAIPRTLKLICEIKTVNAFAFKPEEWGADGTDKVPIEYYAQCQHNMIVTDSIQCDMPVLIAGSKFVVYHIPLDEVFCARMIALEASFWMAVREGREPEPQDVSDLLLKYPGHVPGKTVEASAGALKAYSVWLKHDQAASMHSEICDRQKLTMQKFMKDAETLVAAGVVLATWRTTEKGRRFLPKRPKEIQAEQKDAQSERKLKPTPKASKTEMSEQPAQQTASTTP